jgi:predicted secreted protein
MSSFDRRQCLRHVALLAASMGLLATEPLHAAETRQSIAMAVGVERIVTLSENPSTGYRWQLNRTASSNLAIVDVTDAGFAPGHGRRIGAPGLRRWRIVGRASGKAVVVFDYSRPWERVAPASRHLLTVDVGGR